MPKKKGHTTAVVGKTALVLERVILILWICSSLSFKLGLVGFIAT